MSVHELVLSQTGNVLDHSMNFRGKTWTSASVSRAAAAIAATSRGVRYGDGVFVTLGIRDGILLDAWAQLDRIRRAAAAIGLEPPRLFEHEEQAPWRLATILERLGAGGRTDATARLQWFAGPGGRGFGRDDVVAEAIVDLGPPPAPRRPSIVVVGEDEAPRPALPRWKTCSALAHVLCERAAAERGADAAVRSEAGTLIEAGSANLFWLSGVTLRTPHEELPLYPGSVRARVIESAEAAGLPVEEGRFEADDLAEADAVLLTNAARGIEFASSFDGRPLPEPPTIAVALADAVEARREAEGIELRAPDAPA